MTAARIRKIRQSLGWTQKYLAQFMGVNVRTVQNWEAKGCAKSVWMALQGLGK